jgi:4-hydroxythreonine-4-phosphate dehydrogenase
MGDPAGIGPEVCIRLLDRISQGDCNECIPLVFGNVDILSQVSERIGVPIVCPVVSSTEAVNKPAILHCETGELTKIIPGRVQPECGEASLQYVLQAIAHVKGNTVDGIVTCPVSKEALALAGYSYPGHTELFAEHFAESETCMMQYAADIACSFVTTHIGYNEVPLHLTTERITAVLRLTNTALRTIRGIVPRILVCGLNPHAGEHGLFGDSEEEKIISPAIARAREHGLDVTGPVPADTAFTPQSRDRFDAMVCMYHDQGHIPVKMIAFDRAVNITLGLSAIRTSVDHGTAFDIAWKGTADAGSLFQAVRLATQLTKNKLSETSARQTEQT